MSATTPGLVCAHHHLYSALARGMPPPPKTPANFQEIEVHLVEAPQPGAPYGIKGVGEIGLVPTAGAVAAALHEVDGKWRNRLPMKTGFCA